VDKLIVAMNQSLREAWTGSLADLCYCFFCVFVFAIQDERALIASTDELILAVNQPLLREFGWVTAIVTTMLTIKRQCTTCWLILCSIRQSISNEEVPIL
jgi:hypothetical protein